MYFLKLVAAIKSLIISKTRSNPNLLNLGAKNPAKAPQPIYNQLASLWLQKQPKSDAQLSEGLASLGIIEVQLKALLRPSGHHSSIALRVSRGFFNQSSIMPRDASLAHRQCEFFLSRVLVQIRHNPNPEFLRLKISKRLSTGQITFSHSFSNRSNFQTIWNVQKIFLDSKFEITNREIQLKNLPIQSTPKVEKKLHPLSERLASLGIIQDELRAPLKPLNTIVL